MKNNKTTKFVLAALLSALAFIVLLIFRIPVGFLTFDLKTVFVTLAGLVLGPSYALASSLILTLIEMFALSDSGIYGFIMNFFATASFSVVVSLVYKYKRSISGALFGLALGSISLNIVMLVLNYLITPTYVGMSLEQTIPIIWSTVLPFNLIKAIITSAVTFLLYKPLSQILKRYCILQDYCEPTKSVSKRRLSLYIIALVLLFISIFIYLFILKGKLEFGLPTNFLPNK